MSDKYGLLAVIRFGWPILEEGAMSGRKSQNPVSLDLAARRPDNLPVRRPFHSARGRIRESESPTACRD